MDTTKTEEQFRAVMQECRTLFEKKLHDYGASWRILRPSSLTDQLFIKAKRIRSLETTGTSLVGEGIRPEFIALINYGIIGLIQLEHGFVDTVDINPAQAMEMYDRHAKECLELMLRKNHDYNEAWHARLRRHRLQLHGHHQLCLLRSHKDRGRSVNRKT